MPDPCLRSRPCLQRASRERIVTGEPTASLARRPDERCALALGTLERKADKTVRPSGLTQSPNGVTVLSVQTPTFAQPQSQSFQMQPSKFDG
jgi:hypothetical protein